jgi:hypothetical protein
MTSTEIAAPSLDETGPGPGRFPCPACGATLRVGAILCPQCDADLWTMAHGGPEPSAEAESVAVDRPRRVPRSFDRRLGRRSLVIAAAALAAKLLLLLIAGATDEPSLPWSFVAWAATLTSAAAIHVAWKAGGGIEATPGDRGTAAATYGMILGVAGLAYAGSTLITWSIDQVLGALAR